MTMLTWTRPISFVNARVVLPDGLASSIRVASRVLDVDAPPRASDLVVDLNGAFVMPGLVNAHDHLELNHYGRLKLRERYENASAWIDDLRPALRSDPAIRENAARPLGALLFGLGATGTTDPNDCMCGWLTNCTASNNACTYSTAITAATGCPGLVNPVDETKFLDTFCN